MSFFRYPGGKSKVKKEIIEKLSAVSFSEYREPFVGGGSIFLSLLEIKDFDCVWINDIDPGISAIWTTLINNPNELKKLVESFTPSVKKYYLFKEELLSNNNIEDLDLAFKKIALHQMSYSGLGTKSGGPIGGKEQKSNYKIDCRWSPRYISKKIDKYNCLLSKFNIVENKCTKEDFSVMFNDSKDVLMYLDPPYIEKGNSLYQFEFSKNDHEKLAKYLYDFNGYFVLSYDDNDFIKKMYYNYNMENLSLKYTIRQTFNKKNKLRSTNKDELLISNY